MEDVLVLSDSITNRSSLRLTRSRGRGTGTQNPWLKIKIIKNLLLVTSEQFIAPVLRYLASVWGPEETSDSGTLQEEEKD